MLKLFNLYTLYKFIPATVTFTLVISSWEKKNKSSLCFCIAKYTVPDLMFYKAMSAICYTK